MDRAIVVGARSRDHNQIAAVIFVKLVDIGRGLRVWGMSVMMTGSPVTGGDVVRVWLAR